MKTLLLSLLVVAAPVWAAAPEASAPPDVARDAHRVGFYVSAFGDTAFGLGSVNVSYNALDVLQLSAGLGTFPGIWMTAGASVKFLPLGRHNVTPLIGAGAQIFRVSDELTLALNGLFNRGSQPSTFTVAAQSLLGGVDWQTDGGFNLALGAVWLLRIDSGFAPYPLPYLNIGWFF